MYIHYVILSLLAARAGVAFYAAAIIWKNTRAEQQKAEKNDEESTAP